jgi:hypothetical protein
MLSGVRTVITEAGIQGMMANNYAAEQRHAALATEWPTTCWGFSCELLPGCH